MRILMIRNGRLEFSSARDFVALRAFLHMLMKVEQVFIYGPQEHIVNGPEVSPISYVPKRRYRTLLREFKPDLVLLWAHDLSRRVLPKDFGKIAQVPKAIIEVDLYRVPDWYWYVDKGIDLMLIRGWYDNIPIPSVYFPFSFNTEVLGDCKRVSWDERENNVGFVGAGFGRQNAKGFPLDPMYSARRLAVETLEVANFLTRYEPEGITGYANKLSKHRIMLSCSAPPRYDAIAKTFEIMGSGAVCLTTKMQQSDALFGDQKTFFEYKEDCSDVVEVVREILADPEHSKQVIKNAVENIYRYHTHEIRLQELRDVLYALVEGREIPKRWGR